jgi:hypothetical protein
MEFNNDYYKDFSFNHLPAINQTLEGFGQGIKSNADNFGFEFNLLLNIALSRFEWLNLPPTMNARQLELDLLTTGTAAAVQIFDKIINLRWVNSNELNIYNLPKNEIEVYANNNFNLRVDKENYVIGFDNKLRMPLIYIIAQYAKRLKDIDLTIQAQTYAQRMTTLFTAPKEKQLSLVNFLKKFNAQEPFVIGEPDFTENLGLNVIKVDTQFNIDKLYELKMQTLDEFLNYIGIQTSISGKKERLITDEVKASTSLADKLNLSFLGCRRKMCKDINAKFGLDIDVKITEIPEVVKVGGDV